MVKCLRWLDVQCCDAELSLIFALFIILVILQVVGWHHLFKCYIQLLSPHLYQADPDTIIRINWVH